MAKSVLPDWNPRSRPGALFPAKRLKPWQMLIGSEVPRNCVRALAVRPVAGTVEGLAQVTRPRARQAPGGRDQRRITPRVPVDRPLEQSRRVEHETPPLLVSPALEAAGGNRWRGRC